MPPELTVTVVLRPDASPDARSAVADGAVPVQLRVFGKLHHGDDAGTVDSLPLGEFAPQAVKFGKGHDVIEQVRSILVDEAEEVARAIARHGEAPDVPVDRIGELPLEVDVDRDLAERFGTQEDPTSIRHDGEHGAGT